MRILLSVFLALFFIGCGVEESEVNNYDLSIKENDVSFYINSLRKDANLTPLTLNELLNKAAYNHAKYLFENDETGHYEDKNRPFFTGYAPSDRTAYVGYLSKYVIENVSVNQDDYFKSVDDLFSAIYHRFAFLNPTINNIGVGIEGKYYVYDMGNEYLNELCKSDYTGPGSYYTGVCSNGNRVSVNEYESAIDRVKSQNAKIIIWPYENADNIPPVFYEEDPDPLPDYSVSGYPISIEFNDYYFSDDVVLESFRIFDSNKELIDARLIDKDSDVNSKFTSKQFALFPLKRLEWDSEYSVEVEFSYRGESKTLRWSFKTAALPYPYFRITTTFATFYVESGKTYAYYFVPKDNDDIITGYRYTYNIGDSVDAGFIDFNTIWIRVTGEKGNEVEVNLSNGNSIKLIIN